MGFYAEKILPTMIDISCSLEPAMALRRRLVPEACGKVLEVGMGSGINLAFYDPGRVEFVWGLEPSEGMRRKARNNIARSPVEVRLLDLPGEQIPLPDNSVDTVLTTFTLCTIPDLRAALAQIQRVMKPGARLVFCEHGLADSPALQRWQNRITPVWKKCFGGCHLNRPIGSVLEEAGFTIVELENFYMEKGPKLLGYMYFGQASLRG
ncbi:MAG: class I SAM-dependent methyltransferase [Porticoccaceae bacterium]